MNISGVIIRPTLKKIRDIAFHKVEKAEHFLTLFPIYKKPVYKKPSTTTIHKIFETNSSFHVKQRSTGKVQFLFFSSFLLVLTKF